MSKEYSVVVVPGLGDNGKYLEHATKHWKKHGLTPVVHTVGWHDGQDFKPKLERLIELIDQLQDGGLGLSVLGTSAGWSAAFNGFYERREIVDCAVNVCGRSFCGDEHKGFRSFEARTAKSPAFAQSVRLCEACVPELSESDRKRIMTVRPMFGDELVPPDTLIINGAKNITIPTGEHIVSIGAALTLFSRQIIEFINQNRMQS